MVTILVRSCIWNNRAPGHPLAATLRVPRPGSAYCCRGKTLIERALRGVQRFVRSGQIRSAPPSASTVPDPSSNCASWGGPDHARRVLPCSGAVSIFRSRDLRRSGADGSVRRSFSVAGIDCAEINRPAIGKGRSSPLRTPGRGDAIHALQVDVVHGAERTRELVGKLARLIDIGVDDRHNRGTAHVRFSPSTTAHTRRSLPAWPRNDGAQAPRTRSTSALSRMSRSRA